MPDRIPYKHPETGEIVSRVEYVKAVREINRRNIVAELNDYVAVATATGDLAEEV